MNGGNCEPIFRRFFGYIILFPIFVNDSLWTLFYTQKSMLVRQGLIKNSPFLTCKQICKVHFVYGQIDIKKFYKVKFNCLEIIKLQISRKAYSEKILKIYAY
jgi:hypothetical protein